MSGNEKPEPRAFCQGDWIVKTTLADLSIVGGPPLFAGIRPIGQLAMGNTETFFEYMRRMYSTRRMTNNGPLVQILEARLAELHHSKYCVSFNSASMALVLLLQSLRANTGGEVIMPAFTYPGLPHLARWAGLTPVFSDIDPLTHTLDPESVADSISHWTAVILGVHSVTSPCQIKELQKLADSKRLPLIFDSVHGLGCSYQGKALGSFGEAEVFSLHATKLINGFEGGYVTTDNFALAKLLRQSRNFGFLEEDTVTALGLNAKLNEIHAGLALVTLEALPETIAANKARYDAYCQYFDGISGVSLIPYEGEEEFNYEFALAQIDSSWVFSRDETIELLRSENALARPYYCPPLHLSEHRPAGMAPPSLPVTEALSHQIIQMPVGELVSVDDIRRLATFFRFIGDNARAIRKRLWNNRGACTKRH